MKLRPQTLARPRAGATAHGGAADFSVGYLSAGEVPLPARCHNENNSRSERDQNEEGARARLESRLEGWLDSV